MDLVMIATHPDCPAGVSLLADHLDTSLAAGEDLLGCTLDARADLDERDAASAPEALDRFVARAMQLEASLLLRVLQARRLSGEISRTDATLKSVGGLFRAQTDVLQILIQSGSRGSDGIALVRTGDGHAYLRSRGLLAPEAAAPSPYEAVVVSEAFRVGGVVPLGGLLDLISAYLDFIDARYGLYQPDPVGDGERAVGDAFTSGALAEVGGEALSLPIAYSAAETGPAGTDDPVEVTGDPAPADDAVPAARGAVSVDGGDDANVIVTSVGGETGSEPIASADVRVARDGVGRAGVTGLEAGSISITLDADHHADGAQRPENGDHETLRRSLKAMLAEMHRPA